MQRRSPFLPFVLMLLAALLVGIVAGVLLSGDGEGTTAASGTPTARPSGSGAVAASPAGTGTAVASATPPAPVPVVAPPTDVLPPGAVARVAVDVLRIREAPNSAATMLDQLPAGQLVVVGPGTAGYGPVSGEGFAWYPVRRLGELTELPALPGELPGEGALGWAAAGDGTTAYLELVAPRCPARPVTLALLDAMLPWEQLACFGPEAITIDGTFGCGGCGGAAAGTFDPAWLAYPLSYGFLSVDPNLRIGPFAMRFVPDGPPVPADGSIVHVTGHFDDPAATGCIIAPGEPPMPIDSSTAVLYCREQFVVDAIEVTGTDPDFPFS